MGCQPQGSAPHADSLHTLPGLHTLSGLQTPLIVSGARQNTHQERQALVGSGHQSDLGGPAAVSAGTTRTYPAQQGAPPASEVTASYYPSQFEKTRYQQYNHPTGQIYFQQQFVRQARETQVSHHNPHGQTFSWTNRNSAVESGTQCCPDLHATASTAQPFSRPVESVLLPYQSETHHLLRSEDTAVPSKISPQHLRREAEASAPPKHWCSEEAREKASRQTSALQPVAVAYCHPLPTAFAQPVSDTSHPSDLSASPHLLLVGVSEGARSPRLLLRHQPFQPQQQQPHRSDGSLTPQPQQQYYEHSPTNTGPVDMLDKKPTLQVVTTDHSPVSPVSSTSSLRFIFPPDMQSSTSSGNSGSSPFMSPVKREVRCEGGTPTQALDLDGHQVYRERVLVTSGDLEGSETLIDSETGSSLLEDSGSSREQSPFSAMAESLSLRSPSEHSPSPLARRVFQRQTVTVVSEDEGEEWDLGASQCTAAGGLGESESHPPKFKRRLHERYVLSLQDVRGSVRPRLKEEVEEVKGEGLEAETQVEGKRPVSKLERPESPAHSESPKPKSPRRSSSDTDMVRTESAEMASSCDEGDVFMEPAGRARTKQKTPRLHQREPLDLSRGQYPGFRSSSGSSPLIEPDHILPASKLYSPVFRSPHRLNYSPHALMSPQSQSPLCSVPEGGRIFSFNVPSPLEGAHSDSDLISPSPMSPRIFTFPPQGAVLNPMSEVNHLAVSPQAPYTPPPPTRSKISGTGWGTENVEGVYGGKRSLSESDMTCLCPVCGQVFPTNDNLAKHMAKHLPTETARAELASKVHYCKVCNRSFSRSDMLTRHMRLHTGLKPYECVDCGQVFSRSDHLNTHRRTHTGEKPYRCPHCPYAACRRDMITRHMRTHAKRSSRRARYLSVPDNDGGGGGGGTGGEGRGESHKPSGSLSSTETTDSQEYLTTASSGHTCSVSSVDSVDCDTILASARPQTYVPVAGSMDSLLSVADPDLLSSPSTSCSSRKFSDEFGSEEGLAQYEHPQYDRFMRYRKARNWSTTSLESVDSEEAQYLREALVDDAFHDVDSPHLGAGDGEGESSQGATAVKDRAALGMETKALLKCFISAQPAGQRSGSSSSS